jgi:hypothetical protein
MEIVVRRQIGRIPVTDFQNIPKPMPQKGLSNNLNSRQTWFWPSLDYHMGVGSV